MKTYATWTSNFTVATCLLLFTASGSVAIKAQGVGTTQDFANAQPTGAAIHLLVGHSMFVDAKYRLSRIYITDPDVLDVYMSSPRQVLITAKHPGVSSLVVWDENGESHSSLISSDIDLATLRDSLKQALPHEAIQVDGSENHVVLTGNVSTDAITEAAIKLAALYTKDVANALVVNSAEVKQVKLKVRIVEVDRSKLDQFAFNFFNSGGNNIASTTTTQFPSSIAASNAGSASSSTGTTYSAGGKTVSVTNALNFLFYSSKLNVGATIQDMETRQVLQILAEPTITTLSGQKANFLAGGEFPFPVVQGSSGGLTSVTIEFRPYGVKLEFTPVVNSDGTIQLKVAPEVSALDYTNAVQISGYTIPALSTRRAETNVVLRSGQSFAISGLLDRRTTDSFGKTPGIANVPILGALFKSKNLNHSTTELIVIVTPEIVNPLTEDDTAVDEPKTVVPLLDSKSFDATLPGASAPKK